MAAQSHPRESQLALSGLCAQNPPMSVIALSLIHLKWDGCPQGVTSGLSGYTRLRKPRQGEPNECEKCSTHMHIHTCARAMFAICASACRKPDASRAPPTND